MNAFIRNWCHIVFSTKYRQPCLEPVAFRHDVFEYLRTQCEALGGTVCNIGGIADHVHILTMVPKTMAACDFVREIKRRSSHWVSKARPELSGFQWQRGYGLFSVAVRDLPRVGQYIEHQEYHHRHQDFITEFESYLHSQDIPFTPGTLAEDFDR